MLRLSKLQGLKIYNDRARYVGSVVDVLLNDEEGKVVGLALGRKGNTVLSIPFSQVLAIGDIVLARSEARDYLALPRERGRGMTVTSSLSKVG